MEILIAFTLGAVLVILIALVVVLIGTVKMMNKHLMAKIQRDTHPVAPVKKVSDTPVPYPLPKTKPHTAVSLEPKTVAQVNREKELEKEADIPDIDLLEEKRF